MNGHIKRNTESVQIHSGTSDGQADITYQKLVKAPGELLMKDKFVNYNICNDHFNWMTSSLCLTIVVGDIAHALLIFKVHKALL